MSVIQLEMKNYSYWYPQQEHATLQDISFSVKEGEMVLLCGASGSGKSTLLRQLKKGQVTAGATQGEVSFYQKLLCELDSKTVAADIGFVGQNPDSQIVTDKVWHELAFGLESLHIANTQMHRRVAEMAEYFGISAWFEKATDELSGGQKQLLNLASVMVMRPKILLLDEPTSQLDPVAAERFVHTLQKINQDFGVSVLLSEQRLEQVMPIVDKVLIMQDGSLMEVENVRQCGKKMYLEQSPVFEALPSSTQIYVQCEKEGDSPLTVAEGVNWLRKNWDEKQICARLSQEDDILQKSERKQEKHTEYALEVKDVLYSYERKGKNILQGFSAKFPYGSISAILGGNGSGKTTALKVLAGVYSPNKGKRKGKGRVVYLPQDPKLLFTEPTVEEELEEVFLGQSKQFGELETAEIVSRVENMLQFMELEHVQKQHPFDLSGGQQQRLALAKLLLLEPDILLLDEPTKGLDATFKKKLGKSLRELTNQGKTIVFVSHDVDFCAEYAQYCGLLFRGNLTALETTKQFFGNNYFYTPSVQRMFHRICEQSNVITCEEALRVLGKSKEEIP